MLNVAGIRNVLFEDSEYIAEKMDINSCAMIFGAIFLPQVSGLTRPDFDHLNGEFVLFSIGFVIVALLVQDHRLWSDGENLQIQRTGCLENRCRYDDQRRGCPDRSTEGDCLGNDRWEYFTAVILLIIVSSISTPILLKILYTKHAEID